MTTDPENGPSVTDRGTAPRPRVLLVGMNKTLAGAISEATRELYDLREAADEDSAWQAVLLDTSIRAVVGDLHAAQGRLPDLFGRVRASRVQRIRELPLVALVQPDPKDEPDRLAPFDATCIPCPLESPAEVTRELTARLDLLLELARTRASSGPAEADAVTARSVDPETDLLVPAAFDEQLDRLLGFARRSFSDVALVGILVDLRMPHEQKWEGELDLRRKRVGRALAGSVRLEDLATRVDAAGFCVATQSHGTTEVLRFAARLRKVLENVDAAGPGVEVWTSLGVAMLSEELQRPAGELRALAMRRAQMAFDSSSRRIILGTSDPSAAADDRGGERGSMDVPLALALIKAGRGAEVVAHLPRLIEQINPLLQLIREQQRSLGITPARPARPADPPA